MSRPRKKYQLYADVLRMKSSFLPIPDGWLEKDDENRPQKILAAIMAAVEKWLNESPSYHSSKVGKLIRIRDATSGKRLAIIHFMEDHLMVNTTDWLGIDERGSMVYYSDPDLHTKVKFHVSQGYEQHSDL